MPPTWTSEQIMAMAPDAPSAKSGRDLASPRKWVSLGSTEGAIWGECQGSGKSPYQVKIELTGPTAACSCPSRKFPCKHGLGLLLLWAAQPAALAVSDPPGWVQEWLDGRQKRAEQKAVRAAAPEAPAKPTDARAQARRAAQRDSRVQAGMEELERWLHDLVRRGLADVQTQPLQFWDGMASRLVDNQAPGAARLVRELGGIASSGHGWPERLLARLGRLHLLVEGHRRLAELPEPLQAEVRTALGYTIREEELADLPGVQDEWLVLGRMLDVEDRLRVQRTWLAGQTSGRVALLLQFAHGNAPLDGTLLPGSCVAGEVAYFPAAYPLRAILRRRAETPTASGGRTGWPVEPASSESVPRSGAAGPEWYALRGGVPGGSGAADPGYDTTEAALGAFAEAFGASPWLERFPLLLRGFTPVYDEAGAWVVDRTGGALPLQSRHGAAWPLRAFARGEPLTLFGEWEDERLRLATAWRAEGDTASAHSEGTV